MHPKRGKLFDQLFPTDLESNGRTLSTQLCRTNDEGMASSSKSLADPLQTFGQPGRLIATAIGDPVIQQILGVRSLLLLRSFGRNESDV